MIGKGERSFMVDDAVLGTLPVLAVEGSLPIEAFVENDANAPLVAATIIRLSENDFWCHVLARSNDAAS